MRQTVIVRKNQQDVGALSVCQSSKERENQNERERSRPMCHGSISLGVSIR